MTDGHSKRLAKRRRLATAISALGVSLGMTSVAAADSASPTLGEANSHKLAAQSSAKVQTSHKDQASIKLRTQSSQKEQGSMKMPGSIKGEAQ